MERKDFEKLVDEGVAAVPSKFREKIKNVAFLVADFPTKKQLQENDIPEGSMLLGLYEGVPLTERGEQYGVGATFPDRITIFQMPIEKEAGYGLAKAGENIEKMREIVKETIWHEVAHYFGMNEEEVEKREGEINNADRLFFAETKTG